VEFDFDNASLAGQLHDSADEDVLFEFQDHFRPTSGLILDTVFSPMILMRHHLGICAMMPNR
jgi:hypothetical protein